MRLQSFTGRWLEPLVADLVVDAMQPASIQLSLQATASIEEERQRLERHHRQSVERATYKADLERRRYEAVDPANRLVAVELERSWEAALQNQRRAEEHLNRFRQQTPAGLTSEERLSIIAFSKDFRSLWNSTSTSNVDRQNLIRILIDRIEVEAVNGTERLSVAIHWSGGFISRHESRRSVQAFDDLEDSEALIRRAQELYDLGYSERDIVTQLNTEGFHPARGGTFTKTSLPALKLLLRRRGLIGDHPELPQNFWRATHLANALGVASSTLTQWRHRGWVQAAQAGSRWIYWADDTELNRLRELLSSHVNGCPYPKRLTTPSRTMPDFLKTNP